MLKFTAYLNFFLSIVLPCYAAFLYCKPLLFDPCFPEAVSLIPILTSPVTCCILKGLPLFLSNEIITLFLFLHWRQDKYLFRPCNIRRNQAFSLSPQRKRIADRQYLRCYVSFHLDLVDNFLFSFSSLLLFACKEENIFVLQCLA